MVWWTDRQIDKKLAERGRQTVGQTDRKTGRDGENWHTDRQIDSHIETLIDR